MRREEWFATATSHTISSAGGDHCQKLCWTKAPFKGWQPFFWLYLFLAEGFLPFDFQKLLTVQLEKEATWTMLRMQKGALPSNDLCSWGWCLWVQAHH